VVEIPNNNKIGVVLSKSTTTLAYIQPYKEAEEKIREGMFVVIHSRNGKILGRISKIRKYHDFYEEGDPWSEARRLGQPLPQEVARKYTTVEVELLGIITEGKGLGTVNIPPDPGNIVYELSLEDLLKSYGVTQDVKEKNDPTCLPFGYLYGYEKQLHAYIDLNNLTMHLGIFGVTGSGKSNTMGYFLEQISNIKSEKSPYEAIPTIIIDANGDYLDYFYSKEFQSGYKKIIRLVFKKSSAGKYSISNLDGREVLPIMINLNVFSPREIAELIILYYKRGSIEGSEQALSLLTEVFEELEDKGKDVNTVFSTYFDQLLSLIESKRQRSRSRGRQLEEDEEGGIYHHGTVDAVKRAIKNFKKDIVENYVLIPSEAPRATISEELIDNITNPYNPHLVIIDFSSEGATGIPPEIKQFVVAYLLKLVFKKFVEYKTEGRDEANRILLIAIEEAQNYAPNLSKYPVGFSVAKDVLATIATQGRKFGVALALITQRPSFVDPIVISMCNTFIIHRISPEDVRFVESVTGGVPEFVKGKLTLLETGLGILVGQMNKYRFPVLVRIPPRKVGHIAGTFKPFG